MIDWINENNGFLMVVITLVYVIATILICVFNGKSAKASREQIIASQKQQEQNAGLQLYSIRREIINKIGKQQYDEVFWDVPLLFGKKVFDKFAVVGQEKNKLNRLNIEIDSFEKQLGIILPSSKQVIITSQISVAKINKEYSGLESSIKGILEGVTSNELALNSVDKYVECLKQADDLQRIVDAKTIQLVLELNEFTRKSIQQEEEGKTQ